MYNTTLNYWSVAEPTGVLPPPRQVCGQSALLGLTLGPGTWIRDLWAHLLYIWWLRRAFRRGARSWDDERRMALRHQTWSVAG